MLVVVKEVAVPDPPDIAAFDQLVVSDDRVADSDCWNRVSAVGLFTVRCAITADTPAPRLEIRMNAGVGESPTIPVMSQRAGFVPLAGLFVTVTVDRSRRAPIANGSARTLQSIRHAFV